MIFKETLIQSLSFAVRDSRFPPTYAVHFSAFLICLSYRQYPIRPFGAPSPRGEGYSCIVAKPPLESLPPLLHLSLFLLIIVHIKFYL